MGTLDALGLSATAVLLPVLLAAGILHLLSAANLGVSTFAFNALAAGLGVVRFSTPTPGPVGGVLTLLFLFFLVLAVVANVRLSRRFWRRLAAPLSARPAPRRSPAPRPAPTPSVTSSPRKVAPGAPNVKKRIQVVSSRAWVLHNDWGEIRVFSVPPAIVEKRKQIPASDQNFRIVYGEDQDILEDTFTVGQNLQILFPPEVVEKLKASPLVRFEILDPLT